MKLISKQKVRCLVCKFLIALSVEETSHYSIKHVAIRVHVLSLCLAWYASFCSFLCFPCIGEIQLSYIPSLAMLVQNVRGDFCECVLCHYKNLHCFLGMY